jgi:hypothetical protein
MARPDAVVDDLKSASFEPVKSTPILGIYAPEKGANCLVGFDAGQMIAGQFHTDAVPLSAVIVDDMEEIAQRRGLISFGRRAGRP